jgi:hypothetical protein
MITPDERKVAALLADGDAALELEILARLAREPAKVVTLSTRPAPRPELTLSARQLANDTWQLYPEEN